MQWFHWLQWMQWLHWPQLLQWLQWLQWRHIPIGMGLMEASQGEAVVARAGVSAEVVASPSGL